MARGVVATIVIAKMIKIVHDPARTQKLETISVSIAGAKVAPKH